MNRTIVFSWAAGLLALVLATNRAPAAAPAGSDSPLAVVPAQCPIVVHLHGVERTKNRLVALVKNAMPDFGEEFGKKIDEALENGIMNRKIQGLAKDGPVFVAFLKMPTGDTEKPDVAIIARVSSYSTFRDGLLTEDERKALKKGADGIEETEIDSQPAFFVDLKEFAVITPVKDVAVAFTKKYKGIHTKLAAETAAKLTDADLSVYVNLAVVNEEHANGIAQGRQMIEAALELSAAGNKAGAEINKQMVRGMFQVLEDGRAFVAAVDFRPEGLNLHMQGQVGAETVSNKYLKEQKPADLAGLTTLPRGQMAYTGTHFTGDIVKAMSAVMLGAAAEGEAEKHLKEAIDAIAAAGNTTTFASSGLPPQGISVAAFADCAKAIDGNLKLFKALGEGGQLQNVPIKDKPEIKTDAESHRGFKFHYVHITWDMDKLGEQPGGDVAKDMMKKMMGDDMKAWLGTDGKVVLTANAKDWAAAKAMIDAYFDGKTRIGQEAAFQATRKQLPAKTSMVSLMDVGPFVQLMADAMLPMLKQLPLPINLPESIKPVKTDPSYLGIALTLQPERGSFDFYLPAAAVKEARKVIDQIRQGGDR